MSAAASSGLRLSVEHAHNVKSGISSPHPTITFVRLTIYILPMNFRKKNITLKDDEAAVTAIAHNRYTCGDRWSYWLCSYCDLSKRIEEAPE